MSSARFRTVLPVLLLLAGCTGGPRPVPLTAGAVDTFEDGDALNVFFQDWQGIAEGADTRASLEVVPGGFDPASKHFLLVSGVRPGNASGAVVVGVRTSIAQEPPAADPSRVPLPSDVSAYTGLTFAMRGTPGTYIVQLGTSDVTDFDFYNSYIELGDGWSEFRIPFSSFRQEGFGVARPWTGIRTTHIAFFANLTGYFEFGVDSVQFYTD